MLGMPQLATDSTQTTQWQATYEPFGQTSSISGMVTQNLRLPGQYFDSESGWNHNGFRDYIPGLGRYAQPDPLAMQGSARSYDATSGREGSLWFFGGEVTTPYAYVNNDPENLVDPFGLCPNSQRCKSLARKIANLLDQIEKRTAEINANPLQLPEFPPYPGAPYRASVQGHRDLLEKYKQDLADRAHEYNKECGGGDPFAGGSPSTVPNVAPSQGPTIPPNAIPRLIIGGAIIGGAILCPECLAVAPAFL
jgi:RHS repeat-associated protein